MEYQHESELPDPAYYYSRPLWKQYERAGYYRDRLIGEAVAEWAQRTPDRTALVTERARLSYAELEASIQRMARGLVEWGIERGDRILLQLPNRESFVVVCFAACRIGAPPVLAMPAHRASEIRGLCETARPSAYVVPDVIGEFDYRPLAMQAAEASPSVNLLLVDGDMGHWPVTRLQDLVELDSEPATVWQRPNATDIGLFLLSGGTTGQPKLIPRTHADYDYNARASAERCHFNQDTVYLAALPIAHNFPLACPGMLGVFEVGGSVVLAEDGSERTCFDLIERERVTATAVVPSILRLWLDAKLDSRQRLHSLQLVQVGGAPLAPALAARVSQELGCALQQVFGMAEGLLCYTDLDDPEHVVTHIQGRPLSAADELRVVDAQGQQVAPGEVGQLLTRGPYTLTGYYQAAAHNAESFTEDGFYRTGDLVCVTADGYVQVVGRVKEQINRAGEKIAAPELEAHIKAHPEVADAVVLGVPDAMLGEACVVVVVPRADAEPDRLGLRAFLQARGVAPYKFPDRVHWMKRLPITAVGKVDKNRVRQLCEGSGADGKWLD